VIKQINLRNFKCFESQHLVINKLTLLTGLNGMGKSTVLQALLLLRQSYLDGLLPKTGLELNGSLVKMGTAKDVLYEDAQVDEFEIGLVWDDGDATSFVLKYHKEADVLRIDSGHQNSNVFAKALFTNDFHYLQAERLGPRTINAVSDFQAREHNQLGTSGEYAQHFLYLNGNKKFKDIKLLDGESEPIDLNTQVQTWLNEICPGTEFHFEMHPEMDLINSRYSFVTGEQRSNFYRPTAVGFGITYVLPVLVALLSSGPKSIVIIENPEAHLHPRGQVRMGELIARVAAMGVQVIVETHSDHVLNGVRVAVHGGTLNPESISLHYFSRVEEEGRVHSSVDSPVLDKNGRLDHWPDGFFDEWDKSLEHLLGPGRDKK
jgi:predicted ATPase